MSIVEPTRIFPLGDRAITVEFGDQANETLNSRAIGLAAYLNAHPFAGLVEAVPAIASTTVFYEPREVSASKPNDGSPYEYVLARITDALGLITFQPSAEPRTIEVPVSFAPEDGLDLVELASFAGVEQHTVVEMFLSRTYRVFMLGFLPGFAYMGVVDRRIAMPRRPVPRTAVPKGSVGIAGAQTGVYPSASPGGWQIIGRTAVELLTGDRDSPCLFHPGDRVRFVRSSG